MTRNTEYPRMVYAGDGSTRTVADETEHQRATKDGYSNTPSDIHRAAPTPPPPPVTPGDDAMIEAVARRTTELVVAALAAQAAPDKPRRGRPPASDTPTESGE